MKTYTILAVITGVIGITPTVQAEDAAALAQSKNCLACHSIDKKVMGPAFKDVAAKYAGDATAEAKLIAKVKAGGAGVWGPIPMPPNNITDEEGKTLVQWVLSQK